jgi:predicted nucleotide-binding protein
MPYYHVNVVVEGKDYYEYDQNRESVEKLAELYRKGEKLIVSGIEVNPKETHKIRIYQTDKPNKDILGARVWDVGRDITRKFLYEEPVKRLDEFKTLGNFLKPARTEFYHVTVSLKNRPRKDALGIDMPEKYLKEKVVNPYKKGLKFACGGEFVLPEDVESIKITKTDKPAFQDGLEHYVELWHHANEGEDVTAKYLTHTEVNTKRPLKLKDKRAIKKITEKRVFIVHGRNYESVKELGAMLKEFGLRPIVLHEQPSGSRTIVEKLEKYSDVDYAFVILTSDDVGGAEKEFSNVMKEVSLTIRENLRHREKLPEAAIRLTTSIKRIRNLMRERARQNVVLEFGYFMGKLGRDNVCCLHKGDVELPSDMHGIVYIPFEKSVKEVRKEIAKELKAVGFDIKT